MASVHFLQVFFVDCDQIHLEVLTWEQPDGLALLFSQPVCEAKAHSTWLCTPMSDTSHKGSGTLRNEDLVSETALHQTSRGRGCVALMYNVTNTEEYSWKGLEIFHHLISSTIVLHSLFDSWSFLFTAVSLNVPACERIKLIQCWSDKVLHSLLLPFRHFTEEDCDLPLCSFFFSALSLFFNEFKQAVESLIKMAAPPPHLLVSHLKVKHTCKTSKNALFSLSFRALLLPSQPCNPCRGRPRLLRSQREPDRPQGAGQHTIAGAPGQGGRASQQTHPTPSLPLREEP